MGYSIWRLIGRAGPERMLIVILSICILATAHYMSKNQVKVSSYNCPNIIPIFTTHRHIVTR